MGVMQEKYELYLKVQSSISSRPVWCTDWRGETRPAQKGKLGQKLGPTCAIWDDFKRVNKFIFTSSNFGNDKILCQIEVGYNFPGTASISSYGISGLETTPVSSVAFVHVWCLGGGRGGFGVVVTPTHSHRGAVAEEEVESSAGTIPPPSCTTCYNTTHQHSTTAPANIRREGGRWVL